MNGKIGIIAKDINQSNNFLKWLINFNVSRHEIKYIHTEPYKCIAQLKNGNKYIGLSSVIHYSACERFNQIFIEIGVSILYINSIVMPLLELSDNIPAENKIIYFYGHSRGYSLYKRVDCV